MRKNLRQIICHTNVSFIEKHVYILNGDYFHDLYVCLFLVCSSHFIWCKQLLNFKSSSCSYCPALSEVRGVPLSKKFYLHMTWRDIACDIFRSHCSHTVLILFIFTPSFAFTVCDESLKRCVTAEYHKAIGFQYWLLCVLIFLTWKSLWMKASSKWHLCATPGGPSPQQQWIFLRSQRAWTAHLWHCGMLYFPHFIAWFSSSPFLEMPWRCGHSVTRKAHPLLRSSWRIYLLLTSLMCLFYPCV